LMIAILMVVSCPPVLGYATSCTLCGVVYGVFKGWFVAAIGSIIGAAVTFLLYRFLLRDFAERLLQSNKKFKAFNRTLEYDGLFLLFLIRLCPLPFSVSNAALSAISSVSFKNFILASIMASPKIFSYTFSGAELEAIGENTSASSKFIHVMYIVLNIIITLSVAYYIYQRTMKRIAELE
ncbi:hypothetical protein CANCADRAFT_19451, partial [Tortispora caseinolytica NRRL Y-17796]